MPEYLSPGVYVEETGFHPKTIEGIDPSAAAFVGPTLRGPDRAVPKAVTSFAEYERDYGGLADIRLRGHELPNYMAHAARAFFSEGGRRLFVARIAPPAGNRPLSAEDYVGKDGPAKSGLAVLDDCDDVSIVAAPGASADDRLGHGVMRALIEHVGQFRYRFAVLDSIKGQTVEALREFRGELDSSRAALYYPWVRVDDPLTGRQLTLPPSGFICGVYARVDVERGVHKAPANEVIRTARGFERHLTKQQQDVLNPINVNCLRFFQGRGHRIWGARTVSSDPELRYVNVRRYLLYLEKSIERGTQWAVFEPNGEPLWVKVRQTVENFLHAEFRAGAFQGNQAEEAYFVRCDRTTMTQNDIDNGSMICEVGIAPVRPAEFVIFRIGQKTADART